MFEHNTFSHWFWGSLKRKILLTSIIEPLNLLAVLLSVSTIALLWLGGLGGIFAWWMDGWMDGWLGSLADSDTPFMIFDDAR